ncbi:MAG: CotH kinase family protein [Clostridia bacterium]|nr:CotH kinase family protein [Clostridia bacterium]
MNRRLSAAALLLAVLFSTFAVGCGPRNGSGDVTDAPGVLTLPPYEAPGESAPAPVQTLPEAEVRTEPTDGHNWELVSIPVKPGQKVPCAGSFRCTDCGQTEIRTITTADLGVPVIRIKGSLSGITKDNAGVVDFDYDGGSVAFSCQAKLTVQGATSSGFPKKNYTVRLMTEDGEKYKVSLSEKWGRHSKYCLKANYVDFSQARNIVSGRLYGLIAASGTVSDDLSRAPNYGAVDGFPVAVFVNGSFHGLYTVNIPKGSWMFGMNGGADTRQALLMAADWTDHVALLKTTSSFKHGWELEYCSTEDTDWIMPSFNEMINFVNNADGTRFRKLISRYVDVDRAIDALIFTTVFHGRDNVSKNILWATYDGKVWFPSVYDMDDSWGMVWNGQDYYAADDFPFSEVAGRNALWAKLWTNFRDEIKTRYRELRRGPLSINNVKEEFKAFTDSIPPCLYEADAARWPDIPSIKTSTYDQIVKYASARFKYLDKKIG